MKTNYSISIPKPCHEDWSKMTKNEKGRFCQSCSKTVVDFTEMNTDEIQDYIHNNKSQRICGHIKQSQLNTINLRIPETVFSQNLSFQKLFLLTLLIVMGTNLFNCSNENGDIKKIESVEIVEQHAKVKDSILNYTEKIIDSIIIKKPIAPTPTIEGEMVLVMGDLGYVEPKEPYSYNHVDIQPKFLSTPDSLSKNEERKYFHKEIKNILDENFKVNQGPSKLSGKQRIYCQFEINKFGIVENLKIRAPHPSFENEVKRVFKLFPKFIAAKHNGENVSTIFSLPIVFVIED